MMPMNRNDNDRFLADTNVNLPKIENNEELCLPSWLLALPADCPNRRSRADINSEPAPHKQLPTDTNDDL